MQIQQLEYLMKVVECGSITRAAQQLFLSQPSLTKSISNLESEYHIKISTAGQKASSSHRREKSSSTMRRMF